MNAREIRELRRKAKLTQVEFAKEIGVSKTCVINWENKHHGISIKNIKKIEEWQKEKNI